MYHRIADLTTDPWQLSVSPVNFEQQLQVLQKKYKLISVGELFDQLDKKFISSNTVCITFDDGYSDNYSAAKPLLEKYKCPAAFFISTEYINQQHCFWWDELEAIILGAEKLPAALSVTIIKELFVFQLENEGVLTDEQKQKQKTWVWTNKPPTKRCELYLALWEQLKPLPYNAQQSVLEKIKCWADYDKIIKENLPMTNQQLKNIADNPLFDIGLHTASHPALSFHSKEVQLKEIADNEQSLKNNGIKALKSIAYPYGNYSEATLSIVKEKALAAFTTQKQTVTNHSDFHRLGRFQVKNWNGEQFERKLSKWSRNY